MWFELLGISFIPRRVFICKLDFILGGSFLNKWLGIFFLGRGSISWASKKKTCITSSTMEFEFVALVIVGKESEWLRNLIHEISLWPKLIAPISINYDSVVTLAKA